MRPLTLEVQAFRGWREPATIDLGAPITLLVGANRSGKSSTTNALEWCLFGSQVEKKGPGLEERAEWEVRSRDAGEVDTVVTLVLDDDGTRVEITRRRRAKARARSPDDLTVRREGEPPREGPAAETWLREGGLPSWEDYRRAHCFHQEAARTRVVDTNDRSTILAELLGLDEDLRVRDAVRAQLRTSLVKEVDEDLASLERTLRDRLANPARDVEDAVRGLEARGVARSTLGSTLVKDVRTRMVERARDLARRLELEGDLPAADDAEAVRTWARAWADTLDRAGGTTARLKALLDRHGRIEAARSGAVPAQQAWREARALLDEARKKGGDEAARAARQKQADEALAGADEALKRANQLAAVLHDARALVAGTQEEADCPVCRTTVPALGARIDEAIDTLASAEVARLTETRKAAQAAVQAARREVEALSRLVRDEQTARCAHEEKRAALARQLDVAAEDVATDLVAAAQARLEAIVEEGRALRALETAQRAAREAHQDDGDLLRDLERWERARQAAERVVDLDALPSRAALDDAVDAAAAFASDLDALAGLARAAQEERSARREEDVNESLGAYYALITGGPADVRVHVHRTAKKLTYKLVDTGGRPAVPVLNQAALNALSLAMLFAQAETRARAGGSELVVLDDPVQSLDDAHQAGLARAIERLAASCRVIVASMPSRLVERIREAVGTPRTIHRLADGDAARGSRLEGTDTL